MNVDRHLTLQSNFSLNLSAEVWEGIFPETEFWFQSEIWQNNSAQCSDYYMWRHISAPPRNLASFRWSPSIENMYVLCSTECTYIALLLSVARQHELRCNICTYVYEHTLSVRGLCSVKKTGARKFYNALITISSQISIETHPHEYCFLLTK